MMRQHLRLFYPLLLLAGVILLTLMSSSSGSALHQSPDVAPASRLAAPTPTPVDTGTSVPGSTDGIMWMGVIIALVILLPILFSKSTWTRS